MKVRKDFVTNSSSSSFIMAFNNNKEWTSYDYFQEQCEYSDYEEFHKLINHFKESSENTNKENALELLYNYYAWEYKHELLNSLINEKDYKSSHEAYIARINLEKTDEFKEEVRNHVEQLEEYLTKKKQIENADLIVMGTIWDTNGGMLEWAIRNDFIKDNFRSNHIVTWNVG